MDQDTILIAVCVMADDYCKAQQFAWSVRVGPNLALSISEVLTLSLMGRWALCWLPLSPTRLFDRYWRT